MPDTSGPLKRLHSIYTQRAFICAQTVYDFYRIKALLLVSSWINPGPNFLMSWGESKVRRELEIFHHLGKTTSLVPQDITALEEIPRIYFFADTLGATWIKSYYYHRGGLLQSGLPQLSFPDYSPELYFHKRHRLLSTWYIKQVKNSHQKMNVSILKRLSTQRCLWAIH